MSQGEWESEIVKDLSFKKRLETLIEVQNDSYIVFIWNGFESVFYKAFSKLIIFVLPIFAFLLILEEIWEDWGKWGLMLKSKNCILENFAELVFMVIKLFVKIEFKEYESKSVPSEPCSDQVQVSQR